MENKVLIYAGFWKRFLAYLIDEIITGFISMILVIPFLLAFGYTFFSEFYSKDFEYYSMAGISYEPFPTDINPQFLAAFVLGILILVGIIWIIRWLYFALMESSQKQATLGKMILNLKVTDLNGDRISFGRATGRNFGKILSGLILNIGYIMAAFTDKKQALHDILASCLVLDDSPEKKYLTSEFGKYETN